MVNDAAEMLLEIAADVAEVVLERRKKKKQRQAEADEAERKADRERPL